VHFGLYWLTIKLGGSHAGIPYPHPYLYPPTSYPVPTLGAREHPLPLPPIFPGVPTNTETPPELRKEAPGKVIPASDQHPPVTGVLTNDGASMHLQGTCFSLEISGTNLWGFICR
jgi:hypothetical protein